MPNLRERQKAARSERICKTALTLFRDHGFQAIKLEEIAQAADVSAITIYRYFSTKHDLLLAIVVAEFDAAYKLVQNRLAKPFSDVIEAANIMSQMNLSESENAITREMWSLAAAASISESTSEFSRRYHQSMTKVKAQFQTMFDHARQHKALLKKANTHNITQVCYANFNVAFLEFLRDPSMTKQNLHQRVADLNHTILDPYSTGRSIPGFSEFL